MDSYFGCIWQHLKKLVITISILVNFEANVQQNKQVKEQIKK